MIKRDDNNIFTYSLTLVLKREVCCAPAFSENFDFKFYDTVIF